MTTADRDAATTSVTGAKWDRNYGAPEYIFGTEPNAFLVSRAAQLPPTGGRVLVPGDGEGRNGVWLASRGLAVTTVDASEVGVGKALALAASRGVSLDAHCADLERWSWPTAAFAAVVLMFVQLEPDVRRRVHRHAAAALVPGGVLILEAFSTGQLSRRKVGSKGGPPPEMLYTPSLLREDFAGLEIVEIEETDTTLSEGPRHQGRASVVRLVALRPT